MCKSDLRYLNYILLSYYLNYCLRLYGVERERLHGIKVNICYNNHLSIISFWFLIKKTKATLSLLHISLYNFIRVPDNYYEKFTIIKIKKKKPSG